MERDFIMKIKVKKQQHFNGSAVIFKLKSLKKVKFDC